MKPIPLNELLERALHASYQKQWDKALEYSQKAVDTDPTNYLAYKRLSLAFWYLNQKEKAIDAMKKSVELQPNFASAHYNLACYQAVCKAKTEMLYHLKKAIKLDKYTDYREMAQNDDDFAHFLNDTDFLKIVEAKKKEKNKLQKIFASEDYEAISEAILKIDKEIPIEAIEWGYTDENGGVSNLIEKKSKKLTTESLIYLFKVVVSNPIIENFEAFLILAKELESSINDKFDSLVIETWKSRYKFTDAGHFANIDWQYLELFKRLPVEKCAKVVLWGLNSHGKDALQDYESTCALLLEKLPEPHKLRTQLVTIIDNYLHQDIYNADDFELRQKRVRIALSPPPVEVPSGSGDRWANEKAAIAHFHPLNVVNAASHMVIQSDPKIVDLVKQNMAKICSYVTDTELPVNLKIDAVKYVIAKIGDKKAVTSIAPALHDKSVALLYAIGRVMHQFNVIPPETKATVDYLIEATKKENDDDFDLYDIICALAWFKDERVVGILLSSLTNKTEPVRREALRGLGIQKAKGAVPQIIKQLREGSQQCVATAAEALDAIGGAGHSALEDENNYKKVLNKAKKSPRFTAKALNYFRLERVNDDLLDLFITTNDFEAFEHLAKGIANWAKEESVPPLVLLGLDRYKAESIAARYFVQIFNAIARKNGKSPNNQLIEKVKTIVANSPLEDIIEFTEDLEHDSIYAQISKPSTTEKALEEKFAKTYTTALKTINIEAKELAQAMFLNDYN